MPAVIIDGRKIAAEIKAEVLAETLRLKEQRSITPGLAFILVGENPASKAYVRSKGKACEAMGFHSVTEILPASVTEEQVLSLISRFNADPRIHGILVQLPLPAHINESRVIQAIDYRKDVDGFHPINVGRLVIGLPGFVPCTPAGVQELLVRSGYDPAGKHVVIVGRSNIVGKPLMNLLVQKRKGANALVTVVHSASKDISSITLQADILVAAIGKHEMVTSNMIKQGSVLIDVGINRIADPAAAGGSRIVGDVHFESCSEKAAAISPVPGGVGPMTIAMLMRNTLLAAEGSLFG